jgi:hypothetical protein
MKAGEFSHLVRSTALLHLCFVGVSTLEVSEIEVLVGALSGVVIEVTDSCGSSSREVGNLNVEERQTVGFENGPFELWPLL